MENRHQFSLFEYVVCEVVEHDIGIHTAQYMLTILCKFHLAQCLCLEVNLSARIKGILIMLYLLKH